ncbi:MAG: TIGR00341 family protein [Planctomycetes bacterium]|nr:TIGR00341 family protein [Planctomycetota bacterium]
MALRMIELFLPRDHAEKLREEFKETDFEIHGMWTEDLDDNKKLIRILVSTGGSEPVLDLFEKRFNWLKDYRVVLLPTEATLPRPADPEKKPDEPKKKPPGRINREELYTDVVEMAKLDSVFLVMVALSTVVAAVGLEKDSGVIVLSAMVIAPLLGPNIALALATTLGDRKLGTTGVKSALAGFGLAIGLSIAFGLIFGVNPYTSEIASRTQIGFGDIALALAAGAAGAIGLTSGASATLIGVMVAVALLPPTVVTGLLIGGGYFKQAVAAAELVTINLVCLILAAIVTFMIRGIRPNTWWEAVAAKKATRNALIFGGLLLLLLAALVLWELR